MRQTSSLEGREKLIGKFLEFLQCHSVKFCTLPIPELFQNLFQNPKVLHLFVDCFIFFITQQVMASSYENIKPDGGTQTSVDHWPPSNVFTFHSHLFSGQK